MDRNISFFLPSIRQEAGRFTDKMLKFHSHEESENVSYLVRDEGLILRVGSPVVEGTAVVWLETILISTFLLFFAQN